MSIQAITTVLDFAPHDWPPGLRIVAIALADRVNHEWEAWPSLADIADRSGMTPRQVRTHLRTLEEHGVIENTGQRTIGTRAVSNRWIWLWRLDLGGKPTSALGRKPTSALRGGSPLPPNRKRTHKKNHMVGLYSNQQGYPQEAS